MLHIFYVVLISLLFVMPCEASMRFQDEGTPQGYAWDVDCVGSGIICSVANSKATLTISGGGGGSGAGVTVQVDGTDKVSAANTFNFLNGSVSIVTGATSRTADITFSDASTSAKGIASFAATNFTVSSGNVSLDQTTLSITESQISDLGHTVDTNLTQEEVEDFAGAMTTGNTETLITVTYQDGDGTIDYVVDNDLSNYDSTSLSITESQISDLTHTTDTNANTICSGTNVYLDGEGNCDTITGGGGGGSGSLNIQEAGSNIVTDAGTINFDGSDFNVAVGGTSGTGVITIAGTLVRTTDIDTYAELDAITADETLATTGSSQTLINKTIDGDNNTISNLAIGAEVSATVGTDLIISDGNGVIVGHTAKVDTANTHELQVLGTGSADSGATIGRWSGTSNGGHIDFVKSRDTSINSHTIVQDNDLVMVLDSFPDDGVDYATRSARFSTEIDDASPAAGDIGTAFVWDSMAGGGAAIAEVMRLSAAGVLTVNNLTNCDTIDTDGSGNLSCGTDADTTYTGGDNLTLVGTRFNVDDSFIINSGSDTMTGTLTADGITLGANENVTLGSNTLDHDGTTFVFDDDVRVSDEVYGAGWNGSTEVPTKNAVYDKIETISSGGGEVSISGTPVANQLSYWTASSTIAGDAGLTYDASTDELTVVGSALINGGAVIGDVTTVQATLVVTGTGATIEFTTGETADPCGSLQEGTMFYNTTSNYFCYCDGTNDVQMHSPATACF